MSYAEVAALARSWGLVYLLILFLGVIVYALWPSNRARFDDAAQIPLRDQEPRP